MRALDADPSNRFETARDMAIALEDASPRALGRDVGKWVESIAGEALAKRRGLVAVAERVPAAVLTDVSAPVSSDLTDVSVTLSDELSTRELPRSTPIEAEPTVFDLGGADESYAPVSAPLLAPRPPAMAPRTSKGIAVVALAASITVFIGTRHTPATVKTAATEPQPVAVVASETPSTASVLMAPPLTLAPLVPPLPSVGARGTAVVPPHAVVAANSPTAPVSAPARRLARPRPPAVRVPCVAKLDPATGKTIYKGECD
jgi:serine/threonine-protein kinase